MRWRWLIEAVLPPLVAITIPLLVSVRYLRYLDERKDVAVAAARAFQRSAIAGYEKEGASCCGMDVPWPPPRPPPGSSDDGCWARAFCAGRLDVMARDVDPDAWLDVKTANGSTCRLVAPLGRALDPELSLTYQSSLEEPAFYEHVDQSFIVHAELPVIGGTVVATATGTTLSPGSASAPFAAEVDVEMEWALW